MSKIAQVVPTKLWSGPLSGGLGIGTSILTPVGERAIESIRPGDVILCFDILQRLTIVRRVRKTRCRAVAETVLLRWERGSLRAAPSQLFLSSTGWLPAKRLRTGDILMSTLDANGIEIVQTRATSGLCLLYELQCSPECTVILAGGPIADTQPFLLHLKMFMRELAELDTLRGGRPW